MKKTAYILDLSSDKKGFRVVGKSLFDHLKNSKEKNVIIPKEYIEEHMFFTGSKPVKPVYNGSSLKEFFSNASFDYSNETQAVNVLSRVGDFGGYVFIN